MELTDLITQEIIDAKYKVCSGEETQSEYYTFHRKRYRILLETIQKISRIRTIKHMLDIGASYQTLLLDSLASDISIDTLGFTLDKYKPKNNPTNDHRFDLTQSGKNQVPLNTIKNKYDLIILAEVIEHIRIKPEKVMSLLNSLLKKGGYLIIQTPNAAFLGSRIKLLFGKHPYSWIRDDDNNPGHYREYTYSELIYLAEATGYDVVSLKGYNYFSHQSKIKQFVLNLTSILPDTYKNGFTCVLKKR